MTTRAAAAGVATSGVAALVVAQLLLAGNTLVSKAALTTCEPVVYALYRQLLAGLLLYPTSRAVDGRGALAAALPGAAAPPSARRACARRLLALAACSCASSVTFIWGLALLTPTNAALYKPLVPVVVPVMERLAPALAVASSVYTLCLPYAVKAFHYGFIPMVVLLGMQSTPKPKLVDLLTPM